MAFEVLAWKEENCSLTLPIKKFSEREEFSREINNKFGEGGGLNANYRTVEAIAIAANFLGGYDLIYGLDFVFKTAGIDEFCLDFKDPREKAQALRIFKKF